MVTKIGFSGAHCYDLIHYVSRILYHADQRVLLCDLSSDRSLEASVSIPDAVAMGKADVLDYRGVDFTGCYLYQHDRMYDIVILYFGSTREALRHAPGLD